MWNKHSITKLQLQLELEEEWKAAGESARSLSFFHGHTAEGTLSLQVQRELEEERKAAEEQQRQAQEAIEAKLAELKAIEAVRRQEVLSI